MYYVKKSEVSHFQAETLHLIVRHFEVRIKFVLVDFYLQHACFLVTRMAISILNYGYHQNKKDKQKLKYTVHCAN